MPKMVASNNSWNLEADLLSTEPTDMEHLFLYSIDVSGTLGNCLCRCSFTAML